jgi:hypothetical protein
MCKAAVAVNIPWNTTEYPSSKYFLEKYWNEFIPNQHYKKIT